MAFKEPAAETAWRYQGPANQALLSEPSLCEFARSAFAGFISYFLIAFDGFQLGVESFAAIAAVPRNAAGAFHNRVPQPARHRGNNIPALTPRAP